MFVLPDHPYAMSQQNALLRMHRQGRTAATRNSCLCASAAMGKWRAVVGSKRGRKLGQRTFTDKVRWLDFGRSEDGSMIDPAAPQSSGKLLRQSLGRLELNDSGEVRELCL